jgi:hypothetical protein
MIGIEDLSSEICILIIALWEKRNAYRILLEKPEGKRPLGGQY